VASENHTISLKENEEEIRSQLQRVLASKLFIANENSSNFLALVVDKVLKGEPIKQSIIAHELFPKTYLKGKFDVVRLTAMQLRRILAEYYEQEGRDDRIQISLPTPPGRNGKLPAGKSYSPLFAYNLRSPAIRAYGQGIYLQSNIRYISDHTEAIGHFSEAIALDSAYAPAHAAKAENDLWVPMYRQPIPPHRPIADAEASAIEALRLQPDLWRAHVVLGAVHCCRYEWDQAENSFKAALASARDKVLNHPWYPGFLLATGREREGLRIARLRVAETTSDLSAVIALVFFLYVARRFGEAEEVINEMEHNFPRTWLTEVMRACVRLSTGHAYSAYYDLENIDEYSFSHRGGPTPYVFSGLRYLSQMRAGYPEHEALARQRVEGILWTDYWEVYEEFLRTYEYRCELAERFDISPPTPHYCKFAAFWTPLQLALAHMAVGNIEWAIGLLKRAMSEGDPLTVWLHLLPLFDPLRSEPGFQSLIKRMKLPAAK
jgi:hypothetical protein